MLCNSRRTSAERDTVKSSVADRRLWNLGETRHNGFEGQISAFQRRYLWFSTNSISPGYLVSANLAAMTLYGEL